MAAAHMAELGHRGDLQILDDREYGFPRFIGTTRWEPDRILAALGTDWQFPTEHAYNPYPHCRILRALLDSLNEIVDQNELRPDEIDGIKVWVEGIVEQPVWLNRDIQHVHDAQFSIAHGIALGAHRVSESMPTPNRHPLRSWPHEPRPVQASRAITRRASRD